MNALLPIGFQINRARIRIDDSDEFVEEPIPETVALLPRYDAQNGQIPMHLMGVKLTQ